MSQATDYAISDQEVAREIIRQVVPYLDFNKQELLAMCEASNSPMMFPRLNNYLAAEIHDADLSQWDIDKSLLIDKVQSLDIPTRFLLSYGIALFWRKPLAEYEEGLEWAGLINTGGN